MREVVLQVRIVPVRARNVDQMQPRPRRRVVPHGQEADVVHLFGIAAQEVNLRVGVHFDQEGRGPQVRTPEVVGKFGRGVIDGGGP